MKRIIIIAVSLVFGFVLAVEVSGSGTTFSRGPTIYNGTSHSCESGCSQTNRHNHWERTDTHLDNIPPGAHPKGNGPALPPPGVLWHQHTWHWKTTTKIPPGGYGYLDKCTVRYGTCATERDNGTVVERGCTWEEFNDHDDSTCPSANDDYDWTFVYSHTVGEGYDSVAYYDIVHYKQVKKDPNCVPGKIKPC